MRFPLRNQKLLTASKAVASALLLLLASFQPVCAPLIFVALVPWLDCVEGVSKKEGWKRGYVFGLVLSLGKLHWLYALTAVWTGSPVIAYVPWLLASVLMAVYFGLAGLLISTVPERARLWALPAIWVGIEVFRSYIPGLAFPWALLASPLWRYPALIQAARLGTIYLISAWAVMANVAILSLFRALQSRAKLAGPIVALAAPSAIFLGVSIFFYSQPQSSETKRVMVGQTGVDMAFQSRAEEEVATLAAVRGLVSDGLRSHADLLVLPEGVATFDAKGHSELADELDKRLPTLFGAQRGSKPYYQSAYAYDGTLRFIDKTRLVIFGEFVPGRDFLPFLSAFDLPSADLTAGEHGIQALQVAGMTVGPLICFEALFPDVAYKQARNGSQMLAVISVDDWFRGTTAQDELMGGSVWRSVETGLPLARSAPRGYSIATDGCGRLMAEAEPDSYEALQANIPVPVKPPTWPFLQLFPATCFILTILWLPLRVALGRRPNMNKIR